MILNQNSAFDNQKLSSDDLIHYYEAIELLLPSARRKGVYRSHFGMLDKKLPNDYCYFRSIFNPDQNTKYLNDIELAMNNMHKIIFGKYITPPKKVLDVGCGTAGTLKLLAEKWNETDFHGVNINMAQLNIAEKHCKLNKNISLYYQNILDYQTNDKYDLVYFIESAFHIKEKEQLVDIINNVLNYNGEIIIVDIFYPERFANQKTGSDTLFDYKTISYWNKLFSEYNISQYEFIDISEQVSNLIVIKASQNEFLNELAIPLIDNHPNKNEYIKQLKDVYSGYVKLQKLLAKNILKYGILRFRKNSNELN